MKDIIKNQEENFPPYVNWELTNRCNMGCPYCFLGENPEGVLLDIQTEKMRFIIDRLVDGGVKMLNYAGGEPLLRKDIVELVRYGKEKGLKTVLSTNGVLLSGMSEGLEGYLDWISLPVDGYNSKTHDSVRGRKDHFNEILRNLREISESRINLKVNTMLCRKNYTYVNKIADVLDDFKVKKWKFFQFSGRGKAKMIKEEYEISDLEFFSSRESLGEHDFEIIYSSNELRDNAYFLIGADGKVNAPVGDEYIYLGNILGNNLEIFNNSVLKKSKNITNAKISYDLEV